MSTVRKPAPVETSAETPDVANGEPSGRSAPTLHVVPAPIVRRGPILVIDDDPDLCTLFKRTLEHDGHRVVVAADGFEAMRAYELSRPAMIFVDLMMPRLDGEEFLRMLGNPRPPVVLVSASTRRVEVAEKSQIPHSLSKPFDIRQVRALAAQYLGDPKKT